MSQTRKRLAVIGTSVALAIGGAAFTGCGDDDKEGGGEEAGKAVDEATDDVGEAAEDAGNEIDENVDVDVGDDAGKKGD